MQRLQGGAGEGVLARSTASTPCLASQAHQPFSCTLPASLSLALGHSVAFGPTSVPEFPEGPRQKFTSWPQPRPEPFPPVGSG